MLVNLEIYLSTPVTNYRRSLFRLIPIDSLQLIMVSELITVSGHWSRMYFFFKPAYKLDPLLPIACGYEK